MNAVKQLEDSVLPELHRFAVRLRADYPTISVEVYSIPVGSKTAWQGHNVGIECLFPGITSEESDLIALAVSVYHLTTTPRMSADITWGHPSGRIVDEFSHTPIPFSDKGLARMQEVLPRLLRNFELAIQQALQNPDSSA
jgi:hypothetical protein